MAGICGIVNSACCHHRDCWIHSKSYTRSRFLIDCSNVRSLKLKIRRFRASSSDLGLLTIQEQPLGQSHHCSECQFSYLQNGLDLWVGKIPWWRKWQPTPVLLPGESQGQRSLAGYGPYGRIELDMTWLKQLSTQHTQSLLWNPETMC